MQDTLQAENPSQKYIQQMFRRQQPQAPAEEPSSQPQGVYLPCAANGVYVVESLCCTYDLAVAFG